ncbi:MAG: hypothetical protein H6582_08175 [Crocinitomicaceae bacterium]|nr:hypothetical protein [Crocinitomicaceae bacterium]
MVKQLLSKYKYQLLIVLFVLLALYPLTFFIYIPKWDNVNGYLPYRYFLSDYLWNGHLPLWNPFQRLGYLGYADLQSGAWNPIVWVIMLFGKYTINSLIFELLVCYVFAGLGMYRLSNYLFDSEKTSFILGMSYALSGFMVGSSQLMVFLIAVTWFPWIIYALLKFFETFKLKYQLYTALFISLLVTGASPSYTIILAYIISGIFVYQLINNKKDAKRILLGGTLILVVILVLLLPYINSFLEFAPYFNRGEKLEYSTFLLRNPFTPVSYSSFVFPYAVLSDTDWFNITDMTLRNGYFGLVGLFGFIAAFFSKWNKNKIILVSCLLLSLVLAAGGETFIYKFFYQLPGFGFFRHPSVFRAFTIFCALLLAGYELKEVIENGIQKRHKMAMIILVSLLFLGGLASAFKLSSFSEVFTLISDIDTYREFSQSPLTAHVLLNAFISLMLIGLALSLKRFFKQSVFVALSVLLILDLCIQTRLSVPTTVCYKIPQDGVSGYFDHLPKDIAQYYNYTPLKELDESQPGMGTNGIWQNLSTFNKTISSVGVNPMRFSSFDEALEDGRLFEALEFNVMYYDQMDLPVEDIKVDYNKFHASVANASGQPQTLVLNQNYHHLWNASVNGKKLDISKHNDLTMEVVIPAGTKGDLLFEYRSPRTQWTWIFSILGYLLVTFYLVREIVRSKKNSAVKA